jgi:hypothetical protein
MMLLSKGTFSVVPLSTTAAATRIVQKRFKLNYSFLNIKVKAISYHNPRQQPYARISARCHTSSSSNKKDVSSSPLFTTTTTTTAAPKAFAIGTVAGLLGSLAGMGGGFGTFSPFLVPIPFTWVTHVKPNILQFP